ncbi:MAG: tRNA pseudouridine(38-40) synthase TruA [Bacilli bacterium]
MKRYMITFTYDGTDFNGYQKQPKKRTIQGEIEKTLKKIENKKVDIIASGRTDAGVHALNQVAHFDLNIDIESDNLRKALNSLLPNDIYIKEVKEVSNKFHARFNVVGKEYIYIINQGDYNPIERSHIYQYNRKLDLITMERALKYLEGKHDFTSFTSLDKEEKDKDCIRVLSQTDIKRDGNKLIISFLGDGFLRYMVRNIVGTLIEVGEGKRKSEDIITILEEKDRKKAGKTANPEGLYLKNVYY